MKALFRQLDRLLRGEITTIQALRDGVNVSATTLVGLIFVLGTTYGACMGMFSVTGAGSSSWMQIPASMVKLPLLFLFTLAITFPSLYVFNALVGSRLSFISLLRLLVGAIAVIVAVLASLGPIVAFFSLSTTSYGFMVLLNVAVCAASGILGVKFLLQTLHRLGLAGTDPPPVLPVEPSSTESVPPPVPASPQDSGDAWPSPDPTRPPPLEWPKAPGALDRVEGRHPYERNVRNVFRIWVVVFGLVGAQMSWVLRPFIGTPDRPFTFFREREGNFFQGVAGKLREMFEAPQPQKPRRPPPRDEGK